MSLKQGQSSITYFLSLEYIIIYEIVLQKKRKRTNLSLIKHVDSATHFRIIENMYQTGEHVKYAPWGWGQLI